MAACTRGRACNPSLRGSPAEGPPLSAEATRRRPLAEQLAFEAPRAGEPCSTAVRIVPFGAFLELLRRLAAAGTSSNLCSDAVALLFNLQTYSKRISRNRCNIKMSVLFLNNTTYACY